MIGQLLLKGMIRYVNTELKSQARSVSDWNRGSKLGKINPLVPGRGKPRPLNREKSGNALIHKIDIGVKRLESSLCMYE